MTSPAKNTKEDTLFLTGIILSMFCWGLSWTSGKILTGYGSPLSISLFRFFITFVSLLIILLFTKTKLSIGLKGLPGLLGAALCIGIYTFLFFKGLSVGKAGAGGVLVTTLNPIISYTIMLLVTNRKPTTYEAIGLLAGIAAGAVLLRVWDNWQNIANAGNIYFLAASFSWAILSLFTARSSRYGSPMAFSLWMYGLCSLFIFFITSWNENVSIAINGDLSFWANLIFSATITTSLATTFYFVATSKLGASKASSFIFLVPFSAALGSWVFLKEIPEIHTIAGGLMGIVAVYILNKK